VAGGVASGGAGGERGGEPLEIRQRGYPAAGEAEKGVIQCQAEMEQAREGKAPGPAEVKVLVAAERSKVAAKQKVGLPKTASGAAVVLAAARTDREIGSDFVGFSERSCTMPGGDGTGPAGLGPMTGRAAGYCAGYPVPGFMNPIPGRGFWGWGRGGGRGWRNRFYATGLTGWQRAAVGWPAYGAPWGYPGAYGAVPYGPAGSREQELDSLKGQAEYFEDALEGIRKQIEELEAETPE
jgi:hypothetical protein